MSIARSPLTWAAPWKPGPATSVNFSSSCSCAYVVIQACQRFQYEIRYRRAIPVLNWFSPIVVFSAISSSGGAAGIRDIPVADRQVDGNASDLLRLNLP